MNHPQIDPIKRYTRPAPAEDTAGTPLFGGEFTKRDHPLGMGVQWIGTVAGFQCSIIFGTAFTPAGVYELGYKTAGEWIIINSRDPAGIVEHLDMLRGSAEDTAGDNS